MKIDFVGSLALSAELVAKAEPVGDHGSFLIRGPLFSVLSARGTIRQRQATAMAAGVKLYVEQHLNASTNRGARYASANHRANPPLGSVTLATRYVKRCADLLGLPNGGVHVGPSNCAQMQVPAFLAEPGFVSNPEFAAFVRTGEGTELLAQILADTIRETLPAGGLVGLSVGHAYRGNRDPGAPAYQENEGVEDDAYDDEAEIVDGVVNVATELLVALPSLEGLGT